MRLRMREEDSLVYSGSEQVKAGGKQEGPGSFVCPGRENFSVVKLSDLYLGFLNGKVQTS